MIPFTEQEGEFAWGVWAEVSKTVHHFYVAKYSNELAQGTRVTGALANTIPGFPEITGLALDIEQKSSNSRPYLRVPCISRA